MSQIIIVSTNLRI